MRRPGNGLVRLQRHPSLPFVIYNYTEACQYSGAWSKSSVAYPFSGTGVSNVPELPVSAQETQAAGATVTVPFRGTAISWIITYYELVKFPPEIAEVYFVSSIPFVTRLSDLAAISVFSIVVSFLATIIPSMRAARMNPIEALRYE